MPLMPQFWGFAQQLYARPGVAVLCLALQDRCGANVMLMLYCCWRAHCGIRLDYPDIQIALERVTPLQQHLVTPLRAARRALRAAAKTTHLTELAGAAERVQQSELKGEHLQARMLAQIDMADRAPLQSGQCELAATALALYLQMTGLDADSVLQSSVQLARESACDTVSG